MNALEKAIESAIKNNGESVAANKAYLEFIKANFIIPVEKHTKSNEPEVLYLTMDNEVFLPVFSNMQYLDQWAHEIRSEIQILQLSAVNLLKGIGDNVIISLNPGSSLYKEFNIAEISRMKNMILKLFK